MNALRPELIASGYLFPESPRWWDDQLYFSDVYGKKVFRMRGDGSDVATVATFEGLPSGLGQLPDGTRVVVELKTRLLWRLPVEDGGKPTLFADLTGLSKYWLNDLITTGDGFTYTGCYGHDLLAGDPPAPGHLAVTTPDGKSSVAAGGLVMPNGIAVTPDGGTLLVAQTIEGVITAFDRHADGSLSEGRIWAEFSDVKPDGICMDEEGGCWVASVFTGGFVRVLEGGRITHRIPTPGRWGLAPLLAGPDRQTLYLMSTETDMDRIKQNDMSGIIEAVEVEIPGAGLP